MIRRWAALVPLLICGTAPIACTTSEDVTLPVAVKQDHGPVSMDDLRGVKLARALDSSGDKFIWGASLDRFEIQGDGEPIPAAIREAILGPGVDAQRIEGRWEVVPPTLSLWDIRTEAKGDFPNRTFPTTRTPAVRIDFGKVPFVLGPRR